jgi:hypothetical protein
MPDELDNKAKVGRALLYLLGGAGVGAAGEYFTRGKVSPWGPLLGAAGGAGAHASFHPKDYSAFAEYLGKITSPAPKAAAKPAPVAEGTKPEQSQYALDEDAMAISGVGQAEAKRIFTNYKITPEQQAAIPRDQQIEILKQGKREGADANKFLASSNQRRAIDATGALIGTAAPFVAGKSPAVGQGLSSLGSGTIIANDILSQRTDMAKRIREKGYASEFDKYMEGGQDVSNMGFARQYGYGAAKHGTNAVADTIKAKMMVTGGPGGYGGLISSGVNLVGGLGGAVTDAVSPADTPYYDPGSTWSNIYDAGTQIPGVLTDMAKGNTGFATTSQRELQKEKGNAYSYGPEFGSEYSKLRAQGMKPQDIAKQLMSKGVIQNTFVDKPKERGEAHNAPQTFDKKLFSSLVARVREENPDLSPGQAANKAYNLMDQYGASMRGSADSWIK